MSARGPNLATTAGQGAADGEESVWLNPGAATGVADEDGASGSLIGPVAIVPFYVGGFGLDPKIQSSDGLRLEVWISTTGVVDLVVYLAREDLGGGDGAPPIQMGLSRRYTLPNTGGAFQRFAFGGPGEFVEVPSKLRAGGSSLAGVVAVLLFSHAGEDVDVGIDAASLENVEAPRGSRYGGRGRDRV